MPEASRDLCIAYYSRSGHSKRLAERLAQELQAELIEIPSPSYARTVLGYLRAGYDSLRQNGSPMPKSSPSLAQYQHVILVGPIWTSYPAVPLRRIMRAQRDLPQAVSLFLTCGGSAPQDKAFAVGVMDLGRPFVATAVLPNSDEGTVRENLTIAAFLPELKARGVLGDPV